MYKWNEQRLQFEPTNKHKIRTIQLIVTFILLISCLVVILDYNGYTEGLKSQNSILINRVESLINRGGITQDKKYQMFIANIKKYEPITNIEEIKLKRLFYTYYSVIEKSHIPHEYMWYIAIKESRLNTKAKNNQSTAKGMFQFLNGTWELMCKRKGTDIGGRYDEKKQVVIMVEYVNYLYLKHKNWYKLFQEYAGSINPPYTIPHFNI